MVIIMAENKQTLEQKNPKDKPQNSGNGKENSEITDTKIAKEQKEETGMNTKEEKGNKTQKGENKDLNEEKEDKDEENKTQNEEKEEMMQIPKKRYEELVNAEAVALEEVKRARADSINFRRRVEKEKEEFKKFASAQVFKKLIPLLDDIKRLIEHGRDEIPEVHFQSVLNLEQRLESIFKQEGVKIIEIKKKETKFDPKFHDAVYAQPTDEVEPNVILEVVSNGFYKDNTVLRPAKVVISKAVEKQSTSEEKEGQGVSTDQEGQDDASSIENKK